MWRNWVSRNVDYLLVIDIKLRAIRPSVHGITNRDRLEFNTSRQFVYWRGGKIIYSLVSHHISPQWEFGECRDQVLESAPESPPPLSLYMTRPPLTPLPLRSRICVLPKSTWFKLRLSIYSPCVGSIWKLLHLGPEYGGAPKYLCHRISLLRHWPTFAKGLTLRELRDLVVREWLWGKWREVWGGRKKTVHFVNNYITRVCCPILKTEF